MIFEAVNKMSKTSLRVTGVCCRNWSIYLEGGDYIDQ